MADDPKERSLDDRLADLRLLGDRNRAQHPVSILRNDIVSTPPASNGRAGPREPTLEERAEVLARRVFSPVLARAEQLAARGERERRPILEQQLRDLDAARALLQTLRGVDSQESP